MTKVQTAFPGLLCSLQSFQLISAYLGFLLFPTELFPWAFVLAAPPALDALAIPQLSSSTNPNAKTFSKPPFHHELSPYSQVTVFTLSFELNLYFLHLTTRHFELLVHCSPYKMVKSISIAFFFPLSALPGALYLVGAQ